MLWEPAIYDHKAALIGRSPADVAVSADLLTEAVLKEHEVYRADFLTVGLDVFNVEVEAIGAALHSPDPNTCPDLDGHCFDLRSLPEQFHLPSIPNDGRFPVILDAGQRVNALIGRDARVRVAACGPVTMAARLVGEEALIASLCAEDGNAARLLGFAAEVAQAWCGCLREHDLEVTIFESVVTTDRFSAHLFETVALPLLNRLFSELKRSMQFERELVIGGDTAPIAHLLKQTGANIISCDYATDATAFRAALAKDSHVGVRRNIDPATLLNYTVEEVDAFRRDLALFTNPIAGTGTLPYGFPSQRLLAFKSDVEA